MLSPINVRKFYSFVDKRGPDECWLWLGPINKSGYGAFNIKRRPRTINFIASRLAFTLAGGELKPNECVCHKCDNPPCCNPAHLFAGSCVDNVKDRNAKGRQARNRGERAGGVKLNTEQVLAIKSLRKEGITCRDIAVKFSISHQQVSKIILGQRWNHLDPA